MRGNSRFLTVFLGSAAGFAAFLAFAVPNRHNFGCKITTYNYRVFCGKTNSTGPVNDLQN
jgi:hypothetical protein